MISISTCLHFGNNLWYGGLVDSGSRFRGCMCGRDYRAEDEQKEQEQEQNREVGQLLLHGAAATLLAGLKMTWLVVIGRSVDRATRLSCPRAARCSARCARCTIRPCPCTFLISPAIAPTTSNPGPVLPSETAALASEKIPSKELASISTTNHTSHGQIQGISQETKTS